MQERQNMNNLPQGRMLLSHNFDVSDNRVPPLDREQFAAVFIEGFKDDKTVNCRLVNNPHWIVEILFPIDVSPPSVGSRCAHVLQAKRQQQSADQPIPDILVLGGIKTTPATNPSPDALQPGEWGVDVVETASAEQFLQAMGWLAAIAQKPADTVFKIELHSGGI